MNAGIGASGERDFKAFISHAGPAKWDMAIPPHGKLQARGIRCFVDMEDLRVDEDAPEEMQEAMEWACVGVFVPSPEFAGRRWPLKEVTCFLDRVREAKAHRKKGPAIVPVFYGLGMRECRSPELYRPASEAGRIIFQEGFFDMRRLEEIFDMHGCYGDEGC